MGQKYIFTDVPWKRAQKGTELDVYHGFFIAGRSQKQDVYAVTSQPLIQINWVYVVPNKNNLLPADKDFLNLIFAANTETARLS